MSSTPAATEVGPSQHVSINATFKHDDVEFTVYGHDVGMVQSAIGLLRGKTASTAEIHAAGTAEAPGKSKAKPSAAPTAPSQPTAEAAPSTPAPSADAPEKPATATEPAAAAPSAPVDDKPFDYTVLQKAVNERVAKFGKDALLAIATKHGAATFKALDASKWAAAHADVVALG